MINNNILKKYNLVRDGFHDACGIGFIAESTAVPSKRVIELSFKALELMEHRGATLADNHTGDGTGVLTDIPKEFFKELQFECTKHIVEKNDLQAIGMVFTSQSEFEMLESLFKNNSKKLKLNYKGYRKVPTNKKIIGEIAFKSCPLIMQFFINGKDQKLSFEDRLYLLRKIIENKFGKSIKSFPQFNSILESSSIIQQSKMLISSDTAMIHLSDAAQTPVLGLFSADNRNVSRYKPFWVKNKIVQSDSLSIKNISPKRVFSEYNKLVVD